MRKRIFAGMCAIALASTLLVTGLVVGLLYSNLDDNTWKTLRDEAAYVAEGVAENGISYLQKVKEVEGRITLVAPDGTVLYDESGEATALGNHLDRPEIAQAFETGAGESQRVSGTFHQKTIYYALLMKDGNVLRIATSMDSALATLLDVVPALIFVCVFVVLLVALLARGLTRKIVAPLNALDLDNPLSNDVYDELSPLLRRLDKLKLKLNGQVEELKAHQQEFEMVTGSLQEGLVLLSDTGIVLFMNQSAQRMLELPPSNYAHQPLLVLNRNLSLSQMVNNALAGKHADEILAWQGKKVHVIAGPVKQNEKITGAILLLMDRAEAQAAEEMRREFTANVSHELKTPLTSISGYAEIIKNGLAKPEDAPLFAGRIYNEATGMISLVEDILQISRLDEKGPELPQTQVDLFALAGRTVARLQPLATEKKVTLSVKGKPAFVLGSEGLLQEVVFNLCVNAVNYNRPGGSVVVTVMPTAADVVLQVQDTGIGIPEADRERVFERFYRVDKSHSKETGGTGLGLSIVKHGVLCHGGTVTLQSQLGQGTVVTVRLPAEKREVEPQG